MGLHEVASLRLLRLLWVVATPMVIHKDAPAVEAIEAQRLRVPLVLRQLPRVMPPAHANQGLHTSRANPVVSLGLPEWISNRISSPQAGQLAGMHVLPEQPKGRMRTGRKQVRVAAQQGRERVRPGLRRKATIGSQVALQRTSHASVLVSRVGVGNTGSLV